MKWLLLHPSGIRFCFVGEQDLGKQAVFCACLVAVANHLLHMCSTEGSSWLPTQVRGPSLAYEHPVGTFGKELSSEYKLPLCLRSPTILKDSVAFKNSLKIGVGFFSSAPLWRSLLSPMLGHNWNSSCVPAPLGWAYSSLEFNYLVAFWPQLSEELEKSYNCVDFLFSHCALWRSKS